LGNGPEIEHEKRDRITKNLISKIQDGNPISNTKTKDQKPKHQIIMFRKREEESIYRKP